ncbi:hypothetical protein CROQUDRAFT_93949 [Cronartium quercuum f. sp. fusiforme G11]|uniref:Uncharacterized protein n=1 Tax=Cronartium quercuum f. sp. fusiforme G11 TaxID=708437 RepID=A0A9P6TAL2_9BASI|nr:hypothetical protein CROQUDRAFT_93949 [Cronartium quercuum f. sp. fusiforme G11]
MRLKVGGHMRSSWGGYELPGTVKKEAGVQTWRSMISPKPENLQTQKKVEVIDVDSSDDEGLPEEDEFYLKKYINAPLAFETETQLKNHINAASAEAKVCLDKPELKQLCDAVLEVFRELQNARQHDSKSVHSFQQLAVDELVDQGLSDAEKETFKEIRKIMRNWSKYTEEERRAILENLNIDYPASESAAKDIEESEDRPLGFSEDQTFEPVQTNALGVNFPQTKRPAVSDTLEAAKYARYD